MNTHVHQVRWQQNLQHTTSNAFMYNPGYSNYYGSSGFIAPNLTQMIEAMLSKENLLKDFLLNLLGQKNNGFFSISFIAAKLNVSDYEIAQAVKLSRTLALSSDGSFVTNRLPVSGFVWKTAEKVVTLVKQAIDHYFGDENILRPGSYVRKLLLNNQHHAMKLNDLLLLQKVNMILSHFQHFKTPLEIIALAVHRSSIAEIMQDPNTGQKLIVRKNGIPEIRTWVRNKAHSSITPSLHSSYGVPFTKSPDEILVMNFNVLADFLANPDWFPYVAQDNLKWSKRCHSIITNITNHRPDILCLQELQTPLDKSDCKSDHKQQILNSLKTIGYSGQAVEKDHKRSLVKGALKYTIANAIVWRKEKFDLIDSYYVSYDEELDKMCRKQNITPRSYAINGQIAQFVILRHRATNKMLIVANTHITANWRAQYVQVAQAQVCIKKLEQLKKRYKQASVILCGDLNSQPNTSVYEFISSGKITENTQYLDSVSSFKIAHPFPSDHTHSLDLSSSYKELLGSEPKYTNYTDNFKGCLDYIWSDSSLVPTAVLDICSTQTLSEDTAIPNARFPSDHLPLLTVLKICNNSTNAIANSSCNVI